MVHAFCTSKTSSLWSVQKYLPGGPLPRCVCKEAFSDDFFRKNIFGQIFGSLSLCSETLKDHRLNVKSQVLTMQTQPEKKAAGDGG